MDIGQAAREPGLARCAAAGLGGEILLAHWLTAGLAVGLGDAMTGSM